MRMELSKRRGAGKTEKQTSPQSENFAGKTQNKETPQSIIWRGRHNLRLPRNSDFWRGTLKTRLPRNDQLSAGNTEFQSSPCCGEDCSTTYIIFPRSRVVPGVGKDGLPLSPPCPFPLPGDIGEKERKVEKEKNGK